MNGSSDWVSDPDIGGPYGYYIVVIQRDGIRFSCDSPVVQLAAPEDIYASLRETQRRLIRAQPKTLKAAFDATEPAGQRKSPPAWWERVLGGKS
jgi:hypothetical protein